MRDGMFVTDEQTVESMGGSGKASVFMAGGDQ